MIRAHIYSPEQSIPAEVQALKFLASPSQELDKLQSSAKQEVASAHAKVGPSCPAISDQIRLNLLQPHQADQMFDPQRMGSSYASMLYTTSTSSVHDAALPEITNDTNI